MKHSASVQVFPLPFTADVNFIPIFVVILRQGLTTQYRLASNSHRPASVSVGVAGFW